MNRYTLCCGALFLGLTGIGEAAEWSRPIMVDPGAGRFQIRRVLADGDGFVLLGNNDSRSIWMHIDREARVRASVRAATTSWATNLDPNDVYALGGHRFLLHGWEGVATSVCRSATLDADGNELSRAIIQRCPETRITPALDAGGSYWGVRGYGLPGGQVIIEHLQVQASGDVRELRLPDEVPVAAAIAPLHDSESTYAVFRDAEQRYSLARVDQSGVLWRQPTALSSFVAPVIYTTADGDALLVSSTLDDALQFSLYIARYSPGGVLRWQRNYFDPTATLLIQSTLTADDRLVVSALRELQGDSTLYGFDGNGQMLWNRSLENERLRSFVAAPSSDVREAPAEFAYLVGAGVAGVVGDQVRAIEYRRADGTLIRRLPADASASALSVLLTDGSLVHVDGDANQSAQPLHRYLPSGAEASLPSPSASIPGLAQEQIQGHLASGGDGYSLVRHSDGRMGLRGYSAQGTQLLDQNLEDFAWLGSKLKSLPRGLDRRTLTSNDDLICFGPLRLETGPGVLFGEPETRDRLGCYHRNDGHTYFTLDLAKGTALANMARSLGLNDANQVIVVEPSCVNCSNASLDRVQFDRTGATVRTALAVGDLNLSDRMPIDDSVNIVTHYQANGTTTVFAGAVTSALTLLRYNADGSIDRHPVAGGQSGRLLQVERQADGSFVLHSAVETRHTLRAINADGSLRWSRNVEAPVTSAAGLAGLVYATAAGMVLVAEQAPNPSAATVGRVSLLDAVSGAERWHVDTSAIDARGVRTLTIDPERGLALVSRNRSGNTVLDAYALADGQLLGQAPLPCALGPDCAPHSAGLAEDGSMRFFAGGNEISRVEPDRLLHPAAVDQKAIAGTWYTPQTNGQGLQFDYSVDSRHLFGTWFTFANTDQVDTPQLRWYTLAGPTVAGQDHVSLHIYRNQGGVFASGPITSAERVGSAELRLNNCQAAVLSYVFDAGELAGAGGTIPLQRLSPLTVDCTNADGSVEPAQPMQAAASAFHASRSGAWYNPESSGQGFLFDLRPPDAHGADAGLVFGGWFTYEPAGGQDDPTAQHWFMLQGDLSQEQNGQVELPIYRATGGSFDGRSTSNILRVGTAQLQFSACDRGRVSYQFYSNALAGAYTGQSGEIQISRLLPCAP